MKVKNIFYFYLFFNLVDEILNESNLTILSVGKQICK